MKKDGRKKIMPLFLVLTLLLSVLVFVPQGTSDPFVGVFPDGDVWKSDGLTCGEELVYKVTEHDALDPETDYILQLYNGSAWMDLEGDESTKDGTLFIEFNAPGYANLNDTDPIGTWDLRLWNDETASVEAGYEAQITISNLYKVEFKYGGDTIDNVIYNTTYTPIYMYIYNWTGSRYELADDKDFYAALYNPGDIPGVDPPIVDAEEEISDGIWDFDLAADDLNFNNGAGNLEYYLTVEVDDIASSYDTYTGFPVLLEFKVTYQTPDDPVWGDEIYVAGYVKDGQDNGIGGYPVALYSPADGGYIQMEDATTYSTGRYSMTVDTGWDEGPLGYGSAGTWYIGTVFPGGVGRVDESDKYEHPIDPAEEFVRYYWFDVASDTDVDIEIESPDEIIDGFEQTINVSCMWNGEAFDGDDPDAIPGSAWVHLTGLDCYYMGEEYEDDDIVVIDHTILNGDLDESYLVFDITFNETGTGTFIVTHPHDNDDLAWPEFNNTDLDHNISGTLDFQVGAAADMNMVVTGEPEYVAIDDTDPDCWINDSTMWEVELDIYGEEHDDLMNASIQVTGCGLDFTIDEDDEIGDSDYLIVKDWGHYVVKISPKRGGTLTITATNSTDEKSVSKDFEVKGLVAHVTTSIGDDKQITVDREERIIITVQNGFWAEVHLNLFDEDWVWIEQLNMTEGDNTEGNGKDGIYEFTTDTSALGYIVLAAKEGYGQYIFYTYDIVEVVPAHAEIKQVTGGFGVKATIAAVDIDCDWTINIKANFLLSGGAASGTIPAGTEETVQLPFTIALGKVTITVTATDIQKDYTAFAFGPFFLNLKEI